MGENTRNMQGESMSEEKKQFLEIMLEEKSDILRRMACLKELQSLYYDLILWFDKDILTLEEAKQVRETHVSTIIDKMSKSISHAEAEDIARFIRIEHGRLREVAFQRKHDK